MSNLAVELHPHAQKVECTETSIIVELIDGRTITAPLIWFPRLAKATANNCKTGSCWVTEKASIGLTLMKTLALPGC
jgi:hypothetical protein